MRAVVDARNKAQALVNALNQQLGPAINVVDFARHRTFPGDAAYQGELYVRGNVIRGKESSLERVDFKKLKVSKGVTVVFVLK